jgi:glycosyltransferase involved in cell wall biosynthesis
VSPAHLPAGAPISAVIITKNEERRLRAALDSVSFCAETLVVDAGSIDRTCAIATEAGARVVVNTPWPGFSEQRNFAVAQAKHDWILAIDADERVTPALRDEIEALRARGFDADAYRMPRVSFYLGRWIRHTDWYPDFQMRLFDRRRARWTGAIHESLKVDGRTGRLHAEIEHHPYLDVSDHLRRMDSYTTIWADNAFAHGRRAYTGEGAAAAAWALFRNLLLRGGLLLGRVGLTISVMNSFYVFMKYAKLAERSRASK